MIKFFSATIVCLLISFNKIPQVPIDETTEILGEVTFSGYYFKYGFYEYNDIANGVIYIYNETNNKIIDVIINDGINSDIFKYIAYIDDSCFIAVSETTIEDDYSVRHFEKTEVIKYSFSGEEIDRIVFEEKALDFFNHNNALVIVKENGDHFYINKDLQKVEQLDLKLEFYQYYSNIFQGNATINDIAIKNEIRIETPGKFKISFENETYFFEYWVTVHPLISIIGETFNEDYIGDVSITYDGDFNVNGNLVSNEVSLDVPGNYSIRIFGENQYIFEEDIIIYPIITYFDGFKTNPYVFDLEVYQSINVFSNGISMLLNDKPYWSETIQSPGEYYLTIYGVNDMVYHLTFNIYPIVIGVENQGVYENLTFEIFGEAILNGEYVSGTVTLGEPGNYVLDLLYEQQISKTFHFEILGSLESDSTNNNLDTYFGYGFILLIVIGGYIIFRKK